MSEKNFKITIPEINKDQLIKKSISQAGQDLFVVAMTQGARNKTFLEIGASDPHGLGNNTYLLEKEFNWSGVSIDIQNTYKECFARAEAWKIFYNDIKDPSWPVAEKIEDLPWYIQQECREIHEYDFYVGSLAEYIPGGCYDWEKIRPNTDFYLTNALEFDYSTLDNFYDYLQIDIDTEWNNWLLLEKITDSKEFSVITFEHEVWKKTEISQQVQLLSQTLLKKLGYELVANNVTVEPDKDYSINDETIYYFEDWYANPKYIDQKIIEAYKCLGTGRPKYYTEILFEKFKE